MLLARDRQGRTHDALVGRGPLTIGHLRQHLGPILHADVLLVTESREPYRQFAAGAGMLHCTADPTAHHPGGFQLHIENVTGYHSRLRNWLRHFRGVATRYLENYCGWRWALDAGRIASAEALLRCAVGAVPS